MNGESLTLNNLAVDVNAVITGNLTVNGDISGEIHPYITTSQADYDQPIVAYQASGFVPTPPAQLSLIIPKTNIITVNSSTGLLKSKSIEVTGSITNATDITSTTSLTTATVYATTINATTINSNFLTASTSGSVCTGYKLVSHLANINQLGIDISSPTEKRRMIITPNQAMASDDSSTRSMNVYDGAEGVDDALMPSQHSAVDARMIGGTRVATGSEIYVYFERPPIGWKCTAARLELFNKSSNAASSKKIEIFSRSYITTVDASPSNSDYLTIHVNQALDKRTCTDVTFTVAWTPTSTNYLVGHITAGSSNSIFMGGWVQIERI
jgi:hypothetical protein